MTINRNARLSKLEAHLQRVGPGSVPRLLQCISAPRLSEIRLELLFGTAYQRAGALSPRLPKRGAAYAGALLIPDDVRAHFCGCIRHESPAGDFTYLPEVNVWFFDDILWRLPRSVTKLDI